MYSYTYDIETGGILLNLTPPLISKEPRPVYATELDVLGFDKYWEYDKQAKTPYMWAEANTYFYRGVQVAKLKGGNIYDAPEIILATDEIGNAIKLEPNGVSLRPIDIKLMVERNKEILEIIENTTSKKIVNIYKKYKDKLDCFHVAFSGGKDSCVLLDLVKKALPKGSFIVVFGDTGMEFPDTYDLIKQVETNCKKEEIPFYTAQSHMTPQESWQKFGPPSRVLRWCCSVHKSTPQTLKLREVTGKNNYKGLAFVGVRAAESATRAEYEYENFGKKLKGQYSHNSILEWSSAEIWLYMLANNIIINSAYKKGNSRAGCLLCPMSVGGNSDYFRYKNYKNDISFYLENIKESYSGLKWNSDNKNSYIKKGAWSARNNGRDILNNDLRYSEKIINGNLIIEIKHPSSDWHEWIKTLGKIQQNKDYFILNHKGMSVDFKLETTEDGFIVIIKENILKIKPYLAKLFKQTFKKATYCLSCKVCEVNCKNGSIIFENGKLKINNCLECTECHSIDSGCLAFHSLRQPSGEGKIMKSINSFAGHAPKSEWLQAFFELKNAFFNEHTLGTMMISMFKRFLSDAELNNKNQLTDFAYLIGKNIWDSTISQGLILINLVANNPQIEWYVKNLAIGHFLSRVQIIEMLMEANLSDKAAKFVISDYKRLTLTPFGTVLNLGYVSDNGDLVRTKCNVDDHRVVLYGLFKFAEKCNNYKEFTLATLLNDSIERDGVSPTRIFGIERDEMEKLLLGLSTRYPEFISASFTHDLEKIILAEDKSSQDVLTLF